MHHNKASCFIQGIIAPLAQHHVLFQVPSDVSAHRGHSYLAEEETGQATYMRSACNAGLDFDSCSSEVLV